jgi:hypothetical protein
VRLLAVAALVVTTVARNAYAEPAIEDVRLDYRAPKSCPSEAWIVRRIQTRTDRFRRVTDTTTARTFSIAIAESPAGYFGTLEITEPEPGRTTSRRIEAPKCIEVADGLALIAALTIDPRAASVDAPIEAAGGAEQTGAQEAPQPQKPEATSPPAQIAPPLPSPELDEGDDDTTARAASRKSYVRLGAGAVAIGGVAPQPMYGGQVFAELGVKPGRHWLAWAGRLNLRHVRREGLAFPEGKAHFRLSTVGVDLCPIRVPVPTLELGPCATGDVGLLESEGTDNPDSRQSRRAWAALGALLRAGVALGHVGIEASGGATAPLRRDRFILATEIGEVDFLVWSASLAVTGTID